MWIARNWRHVVVWQEEAEEEGQCGKEGIPKEMEMSVDTVPPTFCDLVGVLVRRMRLQWWVAGG